MIKFQKEQKIFDIAGVKVGGQPGECPTVLIGTIFYEKHKVVNDPVKGYFDRQSAKSLIEKQEEMSNLTGNPSILDVFASTAEALCRYIDFVADVNEAPFLVDSMSSSERIPAIKHAIEIGLQERAIYNSIDYTVTKEEISSLKELGVKSAVILTYNPTNVWTEGRTEILKGNKAQRGLLKAAEEARIKNILIDTSVLDVPSISIAAKAIYSIKSEFGLPAGCAPSNAITTWKKVKKGLGPYAYDVCMASGAVVTQLSGANFVLYGPIEFAEKVFPACALTDALNIYYGRRMGIKPQVSEHPLVKIF